MAIRRMTIYGTLMVMVVSSLFIIQSDDVTGFSTDGDFFETDDILFWLNFNDDIEDKSVNRYNVISDKEVDYENSFVYDEKMMNFTDEQYLYLTSESSIEELNLNQVDTDCFMRISFWMDADDVKGGTNNHIMPLVSKYNTSDSVNYYGWEIELENWQNGGGGRIRFKVSNIENTTQPYFLSIDPFNDFNLPKSYFYNRSFVRAGWDFNPNTGQGAHGHLWMELMIKNDTNSQKIDIYRNDMEIINLPLSSSHALHIGRHSRSNVGYYYEGILEELCISRGQPFPPLPSGAPPNMGMWEYHNITHSLPHENEIAYYNFENVELKESLTYDDECYMFFDGAHAVPHNGMIVADEYEGSLSYDNSECLVLDGEIYGQIKKDIDEWWISGGDLHLEGWPKSDGQNNKKTFEIGCVFKKTGSSQYDMILLSKFGLFRVLGAPDKTYGYKIGIDTDGYLFADLGINWTVVSFQMDNATVQGDTWYKCQLTVEKYVINNVYYVDMALDLWRYMGASWNHVGRDVYQYSHPRWYDTSWIPTWRINDITDWWMGDAIIGGTWDSNTNRVVVDKFEGMIDDAKWFKTSAYDLRGLNKFKTYNAP